jgi:hypothetical protein
VRPPAHRQAPLAAGRKLARAAGHRELKHHLLSSSLCATTPRGACSMSARVSPAPRLRVRLPNPPSPRISLPSSSPRVSRILASLRTGSWRRGSWYGSEDDWLIFTWTLDRKIVMGRIVSWYNVLSYIYRNYLWFSALRASPTHGRNTNIGFRQKQLAT